MAWYNELEKFERSYLQLSNTSLCLSDIMEQ